MKNKWHTGTLFFKDGRYWWSYKFETCRECKTVRFPHKWRGLCTSCWDKERNKKTTRRKIVRNIAGIRFSYRKRVLNRITIDKRVYKKLDIASLKKNRKHSLKTYTDKNREILNLRNKVYRRLQKWLPCLAIIIEWEKKYFPFEWIEKTKLCKWSSIFWIWEKKERVWVTTRILS